VASVPDDKKGEKLVVFYTRDIDIPALMNGLKNDGLPNLWIPNAELFYRLETIPLLGSGKLDLGAIKNKAKEFLVNRS
jgi:acyl-[acyl-carrier-protein]-phospholipid O-acyltransferase/long-chain-fatty-acid--[acyl-carrier-protein] ligase